MIPLKVAPVISMDWGSYATTVITCSWNTLTNMNRRNPFYNYLGKEDHLQHSVMEYLKVQYPNSLAIHVPNEGKRSPFAQFKFKYLGGMQGIPDVIVFKQTASYAGLAIELKVKPNKPTKNQTEFLDQLSDSGWFATWVNSFEAAKEVIDQYFQNDL
jgi:hypothetical protein